MNKNYGFIKPIITSDHWILGASSLPKDIIQSAGDWSPYLPTFEPQALNFETYGCTVWGTENCGETLMKCLFGGDYNKSERFLYILANITPPGSDPHLISELWRKNGVVDQEILPMTSSLEEFVKPNPLTNDIVIKGQEWLKKYDFNHEWVFTNNPNKEARIALLKEALKYSPIGISVTAWYKNAQGLFIDNGQPNCHWVCLYKIDDDGTMYVFDSYDLVLNGNATDITKKLSPDHHIEFAKRYYIGLKKNQEEKLGIIAKILMAIRQILGLIQKEAVNLPKTTPNPVIQPNDPKPQVPAKYLWDTSENARHSVRVICDEEGLDLEQKNTMCATVEGESGFNIHAKRINYAVNASGIKYIASTDSGICQWNDYYHAKEITPDEAENNPEKAVRLMCAYWKRGQRDTWIAYKNGSYKQYL